MKTLKRYDGQRQRRNGKRTYKNKNKPKHNKYKNIIKRRRSKKIFKRRNAHEDKDNAIAPEDKDNAIAPEDKDNAIANEDITPEDIEKSFLDKQKTKEIKIKNIEKKVNRPIKKLICSPKQKQSDFTCYDDDQLINIKNMWNERNPYDKVNETDKEKIWISLMDKMKNVCDNEMCWLKQQFVDNNTSSKLIKENFAPQSPKSWKKNQNEWLSNHELENVMKQYEKLYKDFYFIGPSPIDFDKREDNMCVLDDLCHFNLKSYIKKGKTRIGIIFNTDPHTEGGSHWITLFINVPEKYIYFFNSTGDSIPDEIDVLVKRIIKQSKENGNELVFSQNSPKQHQRGGSECGMYSLYFIINVLKGTVKPSFFNTKTIKDKDVQVFRSIFFNPAL